MPQWYENNKRLFRDEKEALAKACPLLRLAVVGPELRLNSVYSLKEECVIAHGVYGLFVPGMTREIEYGIALTLPNDYPKRPPIMFCNDPKLPIGEIDRHILSEGQACLGVNAEVSMRWRRAPRIVAFLEDLVAPFLAWQAYYDAYKEAPPWGERSHSSQGILEFYADLINRSPDLHVIGFMQLLARKNKPKGHEICPCGSGELLRNCHRDKIYEIRQHINWKDVAFDLELISGYRDTKRGHLSSKNRIFF